MFTVAKRDDGLATVTKRLDGYAVSAWVTRWNVSAKMMLSGWETVARGLTLKQAMERLATA